MDGKNTWLILDQISSSKLKDRNAGLQELQSILKDNADLITRESIKPLLSVLIKVLEAELDAYCSLLEDSFGDGDKKLAIIANRVSAISYTIRLLVSCKISQFKYSQIKIVLGAIQNASFYGKELIEPILIDSMHILLTITKSDVFLLRLSPSIWLEMVKLDMQIISKLINDKVNNRALVDSLDMLYNLLVHEKYEIKNVGRDLRNLIVECVKLQRSETPITLLLVSIVTTLVAKRCCDDIFGCKLLIKETWSLYLRIGGTNNEGIRKELYYLDLFGGQLFCSTVPYMPGQENIRNELESSNEIRTLMQSYIIKKYGEYDPESVDLSDILQGKDQSNVHFLDFQTFYINKESMSWLSIYSFYHLCEAYFHINETDQDRDEFGLFKKPKYESELVYQLVHSQSFVNFIDNLLSTSKGNKLLIIGYQLYVFYCNLHTVIVTTEKIQQLLSNIAKETLTNWVLICLVGVLSHYLPSIDGVSETKFVILLLPFIKNKTSSRFACWVLTLIFTSPALVLNKREIETSINNLLSFPTINGPTTLSKESIYFWNSLYEAVKGFVKYSYTDFCRSVTDWICNKWEIWDTDYCVIGISLYSQLSLFLGLPKNDHSAVSLNNSFKNGLYSTSKYVKETNFIIWKSYTYERMFLMNKMSSYEKSNNSKISNAIQEIFPIDDSLIIDLVSKIRSLSKTYEQTCALLVALLNINSVVEKRNQGNICEDIKYIINDILLDSGLLSNFEWKKYKPILIALSKFRHENSQQPLAESLIAKNAENIVSAFTEEYANNLTKKTRNDTDMLSLFTIDSRLRENFCSDLKILMNIIIDLELDDIKILHHVTNTVLVNLSKDDIFDVVDIILIKFETRIGLIPPYVLEDLSQFFATFLLSSSYQYSDISMEYLSRFLLVAVNVWTQSQNEALNSDCNDILCWIVESIRSENFGSHCSLLCCSRLFIALLEKFKMEGVLIRFNKQQLYGILLSCLKRLPVSQIINLLPQLSIYMEGKSYKNQVTVISDLKNLFEPVPQSVENSAFYCLSMVSLASRSSVNLVYLVSDLTKYFVPEHVYVYVKRGIEFLVLENFEGSIDAFFNLCKYSILVQFVSNCEDTTSNESYFRRIISDIFQMESKRAFLEKFLPDITAMIFSTGDKNKIIDKLQITSIKDKRSLIMDSIHVLVPISLYNNGLEEGVFRYLRQNLTGDFESLMDRKYLMILRSIINFIDLGTFSFVADALMRVNLGGDILKGFIKNDFYIPNYKYPISINPEIGILTIQKHIPKRKSVLLDLKILSLWVLSDLQSANSFIEKIKLLREIQFILLYFSSEFFHKPFFTDFLNWFSYFLQNKEIAEYVFELIKRLFVALTPDLIAGGKSLTPFFLNVLTYVTKAGISVYNFSVLDNSVIKNFNLSPVCSFCGDVLITGEVSKEVYGLIATIEEGRYFESELKILGLLISKAPKFDPITDELYTNKKAASYFYECKDLSYFNSSSFSVWFAYFISKEPEVLYDIEVKVDDLVMVSSDIDDVELVFDFDDDNYRTLLKSIFSFFASSTTGTDFKFIWTSQVFYIHLMSSKCYDRYPELFQNNSVLFLTSNLLPNFDENMLKDLKTNDTDKSGVGNIQQIIFSQKNSYEKWLVELNHHLIFQISLNIPQVLHLAPLCDISVEFSEYVSRLLFLSALQVDSRRLIPNWTEVLNNINELSNTSDARKKIRHLLLFIKLIRTGDRQNYKIYQKFYSKLELEDIVNAALYIGDNKFALLIFEEVSMSSSKDYSIHQLRRIYESIDDINFLAGLPAPKTLGGVIQSLNSIEPCSAKTLKINSALFDAEYKEINDRGLPNLINSLTYGGFYGIADAICSNAGEELNESAYGWNLQLGLWKLPKSKTPDSKEKVFYNLLNDLIYSDNDVISLIENSISSTVRCKRYFDKNIQWFEAVREHIILRNVYSKMLDSGTDIGVYSNLIKEDHEILNFTEYSAYRINLQCRYQFAKVFSEKPVAYLNNHDKTLLPIFELLNQAKFTVENKFVQDSLSSIMHLEKLLPTMDNDISVKGNCERALKYITALALWESKETKASISILSDLLSVEVKNKENKLEPFITNDEIRSRLIWQSFESKVKTGIQIFESYIDNWDVDIKYNQTSAQVLYQTAIFLDSEISRLNENDLLLEKEKSFLRTKKELQGIEKLVKNSELANEDIVEGQKHYHNLKVHMENDREAIESLKTVKRKLIIQTLLYYIQILLLTTSFDDDVLDRFCGLWFENDEDDDINSILSKRIAQIPTWKYLPWVNQLTSKLSLKKSIFQKQLWAVLKRILYKLPYDSGYAIINMKLYEKYNDRLEANIEEKITAANFLIKQIRESKVTEEPGKKITDIMEFCEQTLLLAEMKVKGKSTKINLDCLEIGRYWIETIRSKRLPLPTVPVEVKSSNQYSSSRDYIIKVSEKVEVTSTGLSLPKIVTFTLSNGKIHKVVIKYGNDDLRQDAIMEQVFQQVNKIIRKDKEMRKQHLHIRTYNVIPLGPKSGLIEFVNNSLSLHNILTELHKTDTYTWLQARRGMKDVQSKSDHDRILKYLEITSQILPQFRNFFFNSFMDPNSWYLAKKKYTKGVATSSIVGYILGLGDRHLNNILIDTTCGEPVHIDLGIAFDQGKMLRIPELVPFRLTRDIVDGFGITGVEGLFRKTCEQVLALLGRDAEKVMCILNILKWDPLYSWVVSPFKKYKYLLEEGPSDVGKNLSDQLKNLSKKKYFKKEQDENQQSYRALKGVKDKLGRNGLSVEATVEALIHEATDESKLALIFNGWSPFF
ncbi:DNA-binding protein kinase TEL1 RNJ42_00711 [Nakaseomyces bracarensis]|uniref:DNA-binding protein kinase TEL1 n=1 Tax=Nakaseomyces bracarensis TaxID=273131 RepID=UPI0038728E8B